MLELGQMFHIKKTLQNMFNLGSAIWQPGLILENR
jgi:hypothetical protein